MCNAKTAKKTNTVHVRLTSVHEAYPEGAAMLVARVLEQCGQCEGV